MVLKVICITSQSRPKPVRPSLDGQARIQFWGVLQDLQFELPWQRQIMIDDHTKISKKKS